MSKASILLLFSLILCDFAYCNYTTLDGSQLIPLAQSPNVQYDATEIVTQENINQDMLSYYSWFASYGYCKDLEIPLSCCKDYSDFFTDKWTIITKSSTEKYFEYNFVVWRNDEYRKYIFAFPGTRNKILELLSEAVNTKLVNYDDVDNGIKVVNYFYKVALEIRSLIFTRETLNDFYAHPGYQFIFVGHSLGGSVAAIQLYDALNKKLISQDTNPALITYGMPKTGNEKWVTDFNSKIKNILRVVRDGDIVTSLPFLPINNPYRHLGGLILVNKEMNSMNYCPKDIGEDYPDEECVRSVSIDIQYHTKYFNPDVLYSNRCR